MRVLNRYLASAAAFLAMDSYSNGRMLRSPDIARTYAFASIIDHQLRWIPSRRALLASVTFSNVNYVSRAESRRDERFDFLLPGVWFNPRNGVFYDPDGIPVAKIHREVIGFDIQLSVGTKIYLTNQSGTVHLVFSTAREPRAGLRRVETDPAILIPGRFG